MNLQSSIKEGVKRGDVNLWISDTLTTDTEQVA